MLDLRTDFLDRVLLGGNEFLPAPGGQGGNTRRPVRLQLGALVLGEKIAAVDAVALSEAQQATLRAHKALVDVIELLDQRLDAGIVERQRLDRGDQLGLELLVATYLGVG